MGPVQSVQSCFVKYFDISTRAPRSEYWWWTLFVLAGTTITVTIDTAIFGFEPAGDSMAGAVVHVMFRVGTLMPHIAVTVRRLHDTNWGGGWVLAWTLLWVPALMPAVFGRDEDGAELETIDVLYLVVATAWIALSLVILIRTLVRGDDAANRFGPNPLVAT